SGGILMGGTVASAAGTQLTATGDSTLTGVTLAGTLTINAGVTVTVNQGLTLQNGTVQLNGFSNGLLSRSATLLLAGAGPQTLGGTGQVLLAGDFGIGPAPAVNVLTVGNAGALTLDTGVSVVNTGNGDGGTLGNASAPLTVNGTVTASGG